MQNLIKQILKFGIVGIISFLVDLLITIIISSILIKTLNNISTAALIGAFFGFLVSVVVNYILSMNYVFKRKNDIDRKKEFIIFIILSATGLLINEIVIYLCINIIYNNSLWIQSLIEGTVIVTIAKIIATAIVMVYNFVTRKIFLEKKED